MLGTIKSHRDATRPSAIEFGVLGVVALTPSMAMAIPSPELVIGSVSSLSQVLAIGFAAATGSVTLLARRLGLNSNSKRSDSRLPVHLITGLVMIALAFGALNIWQYQDRKAAELAHLQSTLVRPAQFDGTSIQDSNLKETSFDSQESSPLAISTQEAQALLDSAGSDPDTLFFDIRETAEHRMGTLPGAQHVRFPDFLSSNIPLEAKRVVLFCHNGNRSSETCAELAARGIDCRYIAGGIEKWIVEGRQYSDQQVKTLSDLRAIPDYPNRDTLLSTADYEDLRSNADIQTVDTRYPGDFATGHLPDAINIPVRALPTDELGRRISALQDKPTVAVCYDRRSCFMAQVLGLELSEAGVDFKGRYTTPWEFFVAPEPKAHVQEWLDRQEVTYWQTAVNTLAKFLTWIGEQTHFVFGLLALSLLSRLLVLPIALKSERDQIVTNRHADELTALKQQLNDDPTRKARAIKRFYADKGLTPMRNLIALLFLPVMMLGLSATEEAAARSGVPFLWLEDLGQPDSLHVLPLAVSLLAGVYLQWAVTKTKRQAILSWTVGAPLVFALVLQLSAAGNIYLCMSMTLLLLQRCHVTRLPARLGQKLGRVFRRIRVRRRVANVYPLGATEALTDSGNKSYRLSLLKQAGLPVPDGLVIQTDAINAFSQMSDAGKAAFAKRIWRMIGRRPCAVRSSAAGEDGADHSFAGIFESVLNVDGSTMCSALETVAQSFTSARATSYDRGGSVGKDANILVQHMVESEYSGVLFTQDPAAPGMTIVELVEGSGDDLVSGRVTPQSLRFGRYSRDPADAQVAPINLGPLLELGRRIEETFGCPQDIEWVFANGYFQIVQSRDITTLAGGSSSETARWTEWQRILEVYGNCDPDEVILEQDEVAEVLPRPTALSFSLMGRLWAPGGSVDIACRQLGIGYDLPEGRPGHLVTLFGRTYVDRKLKSRLALRMSKSKARQLRKQACTILTQLRGDTIPRLRYDMAYWQAIDFTALPRKQLIEAIDQLQEKLVRSVYVEAEKANILAQFTMAEAEVLAKDDTKAQERLMHPTLRHAPSSMINACAAMKQGDQRAALLRMMGHRAIYDYELSAPRFNESPDQLWTLLESASVSLSPMSEASAEDLSDPIGLAIAFQDLKEQAKHEALHIVAQLRRAVLALAEDSDLSDLIFHLTLDEILSMNDVDMEILLTRAIQRKNRSDLFQKQPANAVSLTLRDCERLSKPGAARQLHLVGDLGGTCVAGDENATGRIFVVPDDASTTTELFSGFGDGDIIVCRMVSPAWLPQLQRAGAVLSDIGGWLSHMAIVAREKNILMLVGCNGLARLRTGMTVSVDTDGNIALCEAGLEVEPGAGHENVPRLQRCDKVRV